MGLKGYDWKAFLESAPLDAENPFYPTAFGLQILGVADAGEALDLIGAEPALGNPASNGYVLSSTSAGVRSWVELSDGLPAQTGHNGEFLTTNGSAASWAAVPTLADGDKGDVTVSSSGATWTVDNNVITLAKMADMATASFLGRNTAGTGDPEVLSIATVKTMLNLSGTNTGDQDLSGYQTKTGTLALAGFGSITGRLPSANLPLGAQLFDGGNVLTIDAGNRLLKDNGVEVIAWDDAAVSFFAATASVNSEGIFVGAEFQGEHFGNGANLTALNIAAANVTGRIGNTNLPLGAQFRDGDNILALDIDARTLNDNSTGAEMVGWSDSGLVSFFGGSLTIGSSGELFTVGDVTASTFVGNGSLLTNLYGLTLTANQSVRRNSGNSAYEAFVAGDASTNTSSSVDNEVVLFSSTGGKTLKRASSTGIAKLTSGVLGTASAGTDYLTPSGSAASLTSFPTLNQNTTGSAASLSISGQTGLLTFTGLASTSRIKTVRDAADTILELGGSYTPTGTWTSMPLTTPKITTGINDVNGNVMLLFTATTSAVNQLTITNSATSTIGGTISATGTGTNLDIILTPKGTGSVQIPNGATSTPGLRFAAASNAGLMWDAGYAYPTMVSSGQKILSFSTQGPRLPSNMSYQFMDSTDSGGGGTDLGLNRAAAKVLGFNNGSSAGATWRAVPTSPSQITGDQNNYNPAGSSYYQRWSTDASRSITGMTFTATQVDGQTHVIVNVGSQNIVLVNESASSTAANRFHNSTGADITLAADQEVNCWYDATTARWRVTKRGF